MHDRTFEGNVNVICKEYFDDPEGAVKWFDKLEVDANTPYRKAYLKGARDYNCFVNGLPYTVDESFKLPELTECYGVRYNPSKEAHEYVFNNAMSTWLKYNILCLGCQDIC